MADDDEKDKSANQILQALDALSQTLHKARANRRTASLTLPRSAKEADDVVGAVDAAAEEEAPRRRLSPMSPLRSRPKLDKKEDDGYDDDEEEEGEDDGSAPPKSHQEGFTAVTPEDVMVDGEKKGITSWGATRVLSHIGMRRFGCVFSVEVVSAQGQPPSMNGLRLAVNVRKKEKRDGGDASDFDEALYVRCSLYGGGGGGGEGKPLSFESRPFLLSVAVDGPEMDYGRSTVDLSQFAMEVTDKCQQWDMVFPLATGKAKGGELVVKLVFQRIDDGGAGTYGQLAGKGKTISPSTLSSFARKLRRSSLSNMLTPKMTRTKTPKLDVPAPDLQGIDSFMLDEPEPAVAAEVEEQQQEVPEPVDEVKEEPQEEEPEREPADEPAPAAEVKEEEEEQKEPEPDAQDDESELPEFDVIIDKGVEGQEEKDELKEEPDEDQNESKEASVVTGDGVAKEEANELETKALEEALPNDVSDAVAEAVEPLEAETAGSEEASVVAGDEVANVLETEALEEATPSDVSDAVAEAVEPLEAEMAGSEEASVVAGDEVANVLETEVLEEATPSDVSDAVADAVEPVDTEAAGSEEASVVAGDELAKEVASEFEMEVLEEAMASDASDAVVADSMEPVEAEATGSEEVSVVAGDEAASELETEAVEVATTPSDVSDIVADAVEPVDAEMAESEEATVVAGNEVAKEMANELDTEAVESATPSDVPDAVAKAVEEPMEAEATGPEEVNEESLQVPEQGEEKGAATKPRRRRRFGWRILALVVTPVAVLVSKNLNLVRL